MPIYQYRCQMCRTVHEVLQGINDPPLTECASCQGQVKKIIAPAGIIFKGSGFHINDYRGGKDSAIGASKKSDSKDSSSTNVSTDKTKESNSSDSNSSTGNSTTTSKETSNSAAA